MPTALASVGCALAASSACWICVRIAGRKSAVLTSGSLGRRSGAAREHVNIHNDPVKLIHITAGVFIVDSAHVPKQKGSHRSASLFRKLGFGVRTGYAS